MNWKYEKYLDHKTLEKYQSKKMKDSEKSDLTRNMLNVLRIVSTYIPQNIALSRIEKHDINEHRKGYVNGTLVVADVNGFTALTEKLSTFGKEGAEEITRILNQFFTTMYLIIFKYRGILAKYGGDAMMIFMPEDEDFCGEEHAISGIGCALEMIEKMKDFAVVKSRYGEFNLSMSMGVKTGRFLEAIVGNEETRVEYYLSGSDVEKTAKLEGKAGKNELMTDKITFEAIKTLVEKFEKKDDDFLIYKVNYPPPPEQNQGIVNIDFDNLDEIINRLSVSAPFLMEGIYDKIYANPDSLIIEGEHRPATVIFLNFYLDEDILFFDKNEFADEVYKILNDYFSNVLECVQKNGGTINKIDMYSRGDKIMILFGVPRAHEDDEIRAVRTAAELIEMGKNFINVELCGQTVSIHQKIGINSGFIFAGNVGSPLRKEYTIMGDAVNLSARIMSGAEEDTAQMSEFIYQNVSMVANSTSYEDKTFKGKSKPVRVHKLEGIIKETKKQTEFFIGREKELEELAAIYSSIGQDSHAIHISGSVGVGKSSLTREFIKRFGSNAEIMIGRCLAYANDVQFYSIKDIFKLYFGIVKTDTSQIIKNKIENAVKSMQLDNLAFSIPLLGVLLNGDYGTEPVFEIENPIEKKELLFNVLYSLLVARTAYNPIIVIFEDSEWIDSNSLDFLNYLIKKKTKNILVMVLSRTEIILPGNVIHKQLDVLSQEEASQFINSYPESENISEKTKNEIYTRSDGNPYFIHEIMLSLKNFGESSGLPENLYRSILARMDVLPENVKTILNAASVIGIHFDSITLEKISGLNTVESTLSLLENGDFITPGGSGYLFFNMMVRDVAYNSLSVKKRAELHLKIAQVLEEKAELSFDLIALHYIQAEIYEKALYYLEKSGDHAAKLNNYEKAIDAYESVLKYLEKVNQTPELKLVEITTYSKIGKILMIGGRYSEAKNVFEKALSAAQKENRDADIAKISLRLGMLDYNAGDFAGANEKFALALKAGKKHKDYETVAQCHLNIGLIYKASGQIDKTLEEYQSALDVYEKTSNDKGKADTFNNIGNIYHLLLKIDECLTYFNQAKELYEKLEDSAGMAQIYNNLGTIYNQKREAKTAIEYFNKSLAIEQEIGNEKGKAVALSNLGSSYTILKEYPEAEKYFNQALEKAEQIKEVREVANIYLNKGVLYMQQNQFNNGLNSFKNAVEIFQALEDNRSSYNTTVNIALLYKKEGIEGVAMDYFVKADEYAEKLGIHVKLESLLNIASLYYEMKNFEKAKNCIKQALETASDKVSHAQLIDFHQMAAKIEKEIGNSEAAIEHVVFINNYKKAAGDKKGYAYSQMNLAILRQSVGQDEEAYHSLKDVYEYFASANDKIGKIFCLNKQGKIAESMQNYNQAIEHYQECLGILKDMNFEMGETQLLKQMGLIYLKLGTKDKAIDNLAKAAKMEQQLSLISDLRITKRLLGMMLFDITRYDEALQNLLECYKLERGEGNEMLLYLAFFIGRTMHETGLINEAIEF